LLKLKSKFITTTIPEWTKKATERESSLKN